MSAVVTDPETTLPGEVPLELLQHLFEVASFMAPKTSCLLGRARGFAWGVFGAAVPAGTEGLRFSTSRRGDGNVAWLVFLLLDGGASRTTCFPPQGPACGVPVGCLVRAIHDP